MKKYTFELDAYSLDELSDDARQNAFESYCRTDANYICESIMEEDFHMLKIFCDTVGIRIKDWSFGPFEYSYISVEPENYELEFDFKPQKHETIFGWVDAGAFARWNKWVDDSKMLFDAMESEPDNWDLTDAAYDSMCNAMQRICTRAIDEIVEDAESIYSMEVFKDEADANDWLFDYEGNYFSAPNGAREVA